MSRDPLAQLRIEHKLDLIIHALKHKGLMISIPPQLEDYGTDVCPVCNSLITITLDLSGESYNRSCACRPPARLVQGISSVGSSEETNGRATPSEPSSSGEG